MIADYTTWLNDVRSAVDSMNMRMDAWQERWPFDFEREYKKGTDPNAAAEKANRFWWHEQNKAIDQNCLKMPDCWLPRNHSGDCQPVAG